MVGDIIPVATPAVPVAQPGDVLPAVVPPVDVQLVAALQVVVQREPVMVVVALPVTVPPGIVVSLRILFPVNLKNLLPPQMTTRITGTVTQ